MFCKHCGSNIPDNAPFCPSCGEVLKPEKEIVLERERMALERDVTNKLFNFFNENEGSAFSTNALQKKLDEIILDRKAREHGLEHLDKILDQMIQNGDVKSNLHNNENFYHISDAHQKEEKSPLESPTIDKYQEALIILEKMKEIEKADKLKEIEKAASEPAFKLYIDGGGETFLLHQYKSKKIYLIVEKLSSSPINDVEVHLSGPPHVDLLIRSRKIPATGRKNKIFFVLLTGEPGFFTVTATLTSRAGHRIAFPIKIHVKPTKALVGEEALTRPLIHAPKKSVIAAQIIFGIIGLIIGMILLIAGIYIVVNNYALRFTESYLLLPLGITLTIIGIIILGILTGGECCDCDCDGCGCS